MLRELAVVAEHPAEDGAAHGRGGERDLLVIEVQRDVRVDRTIKQLDIPTLDVELQYLRLVRELTSPMRLLLLDEGLCAYDDGTQAQHRLHDGSVVGTMEARCGLELVPLGAVGGHHGARSGPLQLRAAEAQRHGQENRGDQADVGARDERRPQPAILQRGAGVAPCHAQGGAEHLGDAHDPRRALEVADARQALQQHGLGSARVD
mmetsp:Transcript_65211/g.182340  ORF Transcript_65211/g.182340 Transcript_65211/m.182340 type:complete len:206 (-) Transcript_65211:155-772(-)